KTVCQLRVVQSQQMQNGRMEIMHVHAVLDCVKAQLISLADRYAGLDATARQPHRKSFVVVIAPKFAIGIRVALNHWCAAKLSAPYDQRLIKQAASLEVFD